MTSIATLHVFHFAMRHLSIFEIKTCHKKIHYKYDFLLRDLVTSRSHNVSLGTQFPYYMQGASALKRLRGQLLLKIHQIIQK